VTGLSELHETRCKKLFNIFESIVHAGGFKKIEDFAYEKEFEDLDSEREVRPKDF
jgi:hypothetical protein